MTSEWKYPVTEIKLSHSGIEDFEKCPRYFELNKLLNVGRSYKGIHTTFGSAVGAGIGKYMETLSKDQAYLAVMAAWDLELFETLKNKRIETALYAVDEYISYAETNFDWQLATINNVPAVELGLMINIGALDTELYPDIHVRYKGFIDLVLYNETENKYKVIEVKTEGTVPNGVQYKFSTQATAYLAALATQDNLDVDSTVEYPIIYTAAKLPDLCIFTYTKTNYDIEEFIYKLNAVIEEIKIYLSMDYFPKRTSGCRKFNNTCKYWGSCEKPNSYFTDSAVMFNEFNKQDVSPDNIDVEINIDDIIEKVLT